MGIIFYASSIPGKNIPPLFPYQDIAYHFSIYLLLGFFFTRALSKTNSGLSFGKIFIFTVVFAFIYGISDEFHQSFVPNRSVSGLDVFIDMLGGFASSIIFPWLQ